MERGGERDGERERTAKMRKRERESQVRERERAEVSDDKSGDIENSNNS